MVVVDGFGLVHWGLRLVIQTYVEYIHFVVLLLLNDEIRPFLTETVYRYQLFDPWNCSHAQEFISPLVSFMIKPSSFV